MKTLLIKEILLRLLSVLMKEDGIRTKMAIGNKTEMIRKLYLKSGRLLGRKEK